MPNHSASAKAWLQRQFNDTWVKKAQLMGIRSRAYFKLQQLDQHYHLFQPNQCVLDCGAAPGGWSQYAKEKVSPNGVVIAIDLLPINPPIPGVHFIQKDFTSPETPSLILSTLAKAMTPDQIKQIHSQRPISVILSDMAPSFSGNLFVDRTRTFQLASSALDLANSLLMPGGAFVCKILQGPESNELRHTLLQHFQTVKYSKPEASRSESAEVYLVALKWKGNKNK